MINQARGPSLCFHVAPLGLERRGLIFYKHGAPSGAIRTGIGLIQQQWSDGERETFAPSGRLTQR